MTPDPQQPERMPSPAPSEREFGRLEGKVDSLDGRLTEFQQTSSREHGENVAAIEKLGEEIRQTFKEHHLRIDALESKEDRREGFLQAGAFVKGAIGALLAFIGLLIGQGKGP